MEILIKTSDIDEKTMEYFFDSPDAETIAYKHALGFARHFMEVHRQNEFQKILICCNPPAVLQSVDLTVWDMSKQDTVDPISIYGVDKNVFPIVIIIEPQFFLISNMRTLSDYIDFQTPFILKVQKKNGLYL